MSKKQYEIDPEEMIIRDYLAVDRTAQAIERTFLAYIRTALAFGAGGIGLMKLFDESMGIVVLGWLLISLGLIVLVFGVYRFIKFRRTISNLAKK